MSLAAARVEHLACRARPENGYTPEFWAGMAASLIADGTTKFGPDVRFDEWQHVINDSGVGYLSVQVLVGGEDEVS